MRNFHIFFFKGKNCEQTTKTWSISVFDFIRFKRVHFSKWSDLVWKVLKELYWKFVWLEKMYFMRLDKLILLKSIFECPTVDYSLKNWDTTVFIYPVNTNKRQKKNCNKQQKNMTIFNQWVKWRECHEIVKRLRKNAQKSSIYWVLLILIDHHLHQLNSMVFDSKLHGRPIINCIHCKYSFQFNCYAANINFTVDLFFNCCQSW